jgi:hypothetical protein
MIGGLGTRMTAGPDFHLGKLLVTLGVIVAAVGLLLMGGARLPWLRLGRLPGDIVYKGRNSSFYFPLVTCLILSGILTAIVWLINLLTKR